MIKTYYREYRWNTKCWSFAYFTCVFGAAVSSASAGVILKFSSFQSTEARNDLAAGLAALGALLVTLSTLGDFQRKWRSNRVAMSAMENLVYELLKQERPLGPDDRLDRIQEINQRRTEGIVGETQPPRSKPPASPALTDKSKSS